jgi:hypothetical protein
MLLMVGLIVLGNRREWYGAKRWWFVFGSLFLVTVIADILRGFPFLSVNIFLLGQIPPIS